MKTSSRISPFFLAALLPVFAGAASAQVYLTDDFVITNGSANDANYEITDGRQGGLDAVSDYTNYDTGNAWNHQVGNGGTAVGQPAGDGNYLLLAQDGAVQNDLNLSTLTSGPLSVSFTLYNRDWGDPGDWGAFTMQAAGTYPFPIVNANEFGFLNRNTGGIQVFDGTGNITPNGWDTVGFATNNNWTFIFSDTSGAGSAFNGNGSQVTIKNGPYTLGTITVNQLNMSDIELGFRAENNNNPANYPLIGVDNIAVAASVPAAWLPVVIQDVAPAGATVAVGSNVVFTAAFSNSPPVSLQWLQIFDGATNDINAGVVTVTNNGVVTSTLTLSNVPLASSGASYQLEAVNATNSSGTAVYTSAASLSIVPAITWYAPGAGNGAFSSDAVLGFAGTPANEVYGVDFGGSGSITTDNGYTFNDYASSGNISVANSSGLLNNTSLEGGSVTTGDSGLDTILDYDVSGSAVNTAMLNNLTVGQSYTVLVLMCDNRTSGASGPNFEVTDGLTVSPVQRFAFPNGTPAVGGFIMGTFTAQATNQPLTVLQNGNAQYMAILLETGTAPAPVRAPALTQDISPLIWKLSPGAPVTLSVAASGNPLAYQWYDQNGLISGATNTTYVFDASAGPGSYNTNSYYCIVTNAAGGATSSTAEVITSTNIVSVYNFSFEDPALSGPGTGSNPTTPPAWTEYNQDANGANGVQYAGGNPADYPVNAPLAAPADGNQYAYVNWFNNSQPTTGIFQDVGPLEPNTTYTLTVAIGSRADRVNLPGIISLYNGPSGSSPVNGATLLIDNGAGQIPATQGTWQDYSVTYTTGPSVSGDLLVDLHVNNSLATNGGTIQANFDNVQLSQEPAPSVVAPTLRQDLTPLESRLATGTPVTLSVAVNGNPLNYQWYNQNGPIGGATGASYSFNSMTGTNSYYVTVTNTAGSVTSSTAVVISSPDIVTVNNFSFEGATTGSGNLTYPAGWTPFNNNNYSGVLTGNYPTIPDGTHYYGVNEGPGDPTGGIYQDVGALKPNTAYTLTAAIGERGDFTPGQLGSPGIISLINGASNTGAVLASTNGVPGTAGVWQDYTITCVTGPSVSGDLTVELSVAGASTYQANFDFVRLTESPLFVFSPPMLSGSNLVLTASGGTAGVGYTLLTTTNLLGPWTTNSTGTFGGAGVFSNSIPIGAGPARFFWLRTP